MMRRLQLLGLIAVLCTAGVSPAYAQEEYERAEEAALDVSIWKELHLWFSHYAAFDNGQIAVMNDGFVEQELARHWETLPLLKTETDHDPAFLKFILSHLNEGTGCDARWQIVAQAEKRQKRHLAPLCRALAAKLRESSPPDCLP